MHLRKNIKKKFKQPPCPVLCQLDNPEGERKILSLPLLMCFCLEFLLSPMKTDLPVFRIYSFVICCEHWLQILTNKKCALIWVKYDILIIDHHALELKKCLFQIFKNAYANNVQRNYWNNITLKVETFIPMLSWDNGYDIGSLLSKWSKILLLNWDTTFCNKKIINASISYH